jgi:hypothetical protein
MRSTLALALLFLVSACGNLDEQDTNMPGVLALTEWDDAHVLALRLNYEDPVILDLQTGSPSGKLDVGKYYQDIEALGDGTFVARHHQSLDVLGSDGRIDEGRSISGHVFTATAISADRSTLAYSDYVDPTIAFVGVESLKPGVGRKSAPGLHPNLLPGGLALSVDGSVVAFVQGFDVALASTVVYGPGTAPTPLTLPPSSTCVLAQGPDVFSQPVGLAVSPVDNRLAAVKMDGSIQLFDLGHYPDCPLLSVIPSPAPGSVELSPLVRFSPNGALLAVGDERWEVPDGAEAGTRTLGVRLLDASTGALLGELPVGRWEVPVGDSITYLISDLLWSAAGDRLTVAGQNFPVQHWEVATATLLWATEL